jgi:hypothetical protein
MKARLIMAALVLLALPVLAGQTEPYYDIDAEVRIEGTVREVLFEVRYKDKAPFVILALEETGTGQRYRIETGPAWFFGEDLHPGQKVAIVGSLVRTEADTKYVIAREVHFGGETLVVRDRRGFPGWRGGAAQRARRRGRVF